MDHDVGDSIYFFFHEIESGGFIGLGNSLAAVIAYSRSQICASVISLGLLCSAIDGSGLMWREYFKPKSSDNRVCPPHVQVGAPVFAAPKTRSGISLLFLFYNLDKWLFW